MQYGVGLQLLICSIKSFQLQVSKQLLDMNVYHRLNLSTVESIDSLSSNMIATAVLLTRAHNKVEVLIVDVMSYQLVLIGNSSGNIKTL